MNSSLLQRIRDRLRREFFSRQHRSAAEGILRTPPVVVGETPFTMLSMVHTRDILSYLVAAKSFARFTRPQHVVVVCDPSITDNDRDCLRTHIPHIELRRADEFTHPSIPRGGTWERLYSIAQRSGNEYVVQLDADTVTLDVPNEVIAAIVARTGFVIGEKPDQTCLTLDETSRQAPKAEAPGMHIQDRAEMRMNRIGLDSSMHYVRGCAGFTGFPPDIDMAQKLIRFSDLMTKSFGDDWKKWGTEQVSSNHIVANTMGCKVLPFPKYGMPLDRTPETLFLHYIGYQRFISSAYARDTRQIVAALGQLH